MRHALLALLAALLLAGCPDEPPGEDPAPTPTPSDDDDATSDFELPEGWEGPLHDDSGLMDQESSPPPPVSVTPPRPFGDHGIDVLVELDEAVDVTVTLEGTGCGTLVGGSGTSPLALEGRAGRQGWCRIEGVGTLADGSEQVVEGTFEVQPVDPLLPPLELAGGVLRWDEPPAVTDGGPVLTEASGLASLVPGSLSTIELDWTSDLPVAAAVLWVDGYDGWFVLPVDEDWDGRLDVEVPQDLLQRLEETRDTQVTVQATVLDAAGRRAAELSLDANVEMVGTGEVQVALTWTGDADLDLAVTGPDGERIWYGNKVGASGGVLDLDANAGCAESDTQAENVTWPDGTSLVGDYEVQVHAWDMCGEEIAPFNVSMNYCGDDSPQHGSSTLTAIDQLATFSFEATCATSVSGRVRYEDFAVTRDGIAPDGVFVPMPWLKVHVVRTADDVVLAEGTTDRLGRFSVSFSNEGSPAYIVRVLAELDRPSTGLDQEVRDFSEGIYAWESAQTFDAQATPAVTGVNFDISGTDNGAVLNMLSVGAIAHDTIASVLRQSQLSLGELVWWWEQSRTTPTCIGSCFVGNDAEIFGIWISSRLENPDDYDDLVLAHEYGHFAMHKLSVDDSPGGIHWGDPVTPALAWSEGWATWFGATAMGTPRYINTVGPAPGGMGVDVDLETLPGVILGNAPGLDGPISESVVSGVLLDMSDHDNETVGIYQDTLSGLDWAIWRVLRQWLGPHQAKDFQDRGGPGRDLLDFLVGWECMGLGNYGATPNDGMQGIVNGIHELSYPVPSDLGCP